MTIIQHMFLVIAGFLGCSGVAAGAFGAHLLRSKLSIESFEVFEVAVRYQMYHALALLSVVILLGLSHSVWFVMAGWLFILGTVIFSGSLYILVLSEVRSWGAFTPVGGLLFLVGWLSILLGGIFVRSL